MKENEVFIIAEAGKNFIQSKKDRAVAEYLDNAKKLVDAAVYAGVDAIKFQTHEVEDEQLDINVVSPHFSGSDRYSWVKRNTEATPLGFWLELRDYCRDRNIIFFSTPMSRKAAIKLEKVGVPFWKVGSGDVDDFVMLEYLVRTNKPITISSGMVSHLELEAVMNYLKKNQVETTLLYCVSLYPCPSERFNLGTLEYFKEQYPWAKIGFSDHSRGFEAALAAIKLGARVIEKHLSLSRNLWGPDHKVSMEPEEMKNMVEAIRNKNYENINPALFYGKKEKELEGANNIFRNYFKKGLVAGEDIKKGSIVKKEMIYAMRPLFHIEQLGGLSSSKLPDIVGQKVAKSLTKYEPITPLAIERKS
ncbi:MAG: N-acetylneuraminate synthase family protein [Candidatus Zambryskibacteria bacterium]|nr:N-acetylneuraminate synthase family protein [Candidatus Zambryskibacteria bacterium]